MKTKTKRTRQEQRETMRIARSITGRSPGEPRVAPLDPVLLPAPRSTRSRGKYRDAGYAKLGIYVPRALLDDVRRGLVGTDEDLSTFAAVAFAQELARRRAAPPE